MRLFLQICCISLLAIQQELIPLRLAEPAPSSLYDDTSKTGSTPTSMSNSSSK